MHRWHKDRELDRLRIPASQVLDLKRSLSTVQIALPGFPSQEATAYLCAFSAGEGVQVTVALHLHASRHLAFYFPERQNASREESEKLIEKGARFAESMGFMLGDLDFPELDEKTQNSLWNSLPLKEGIEPEIHPPKMELPSVVTGPPAAEMAGEETPTASPPSQPAAAKEPVEKEITAPPAAFAEASVGAPKPGRAKKRPPSAREMAERRMKLLENLGRFLASL